jgi:hypothetical protein
MGNYRDDYAAKGIHDNLYAKAIVFSNDSGEKAALLSVDICMMDRGNIAMMRDYISSKCQIAGDRVLIAATHTHSGPAPMMLGTLPKADDADIKLFLTKACQAVMEAEKNMVDSKLRVGYSSENRVSFNRAMKCTDGKTHMNWEGLDPESVTEVLGTIDPQVITMAFEQGGKKTAALVNFGLHPAILAGDNWLYSADYPGYLAEGLGKILGDDFKTMFFNGCCGDVNHIDYSDPLQGRGYSMTQRVGYMLAVDAFEAIKKDVESLGDVISVSREMVKLERYKISEEKRTWSLDVLERVKLEGREAGKVDGLPDEHYARVWLDMYEKQNEPDEVEVMVLRIGDVGIVGLCGEMFCELGMDIKNTSPAKHTIVIELANDAVGYIITEAAYEQGRYESTPGTTMYAKGSGEKVAASAKRQLQELFKS